jgi:membrane fusion protein, multidrug efflux system
MKPIYFKLLGIVLIFSVAACSSDKKAELAKLLKERDEINIKIKGLQEDLAKTDTTLIQKNLKQVAITELQPSTFQHYIEVQGRLDGEENVDVYPEAMGAVEVVNVRNGDQVSKGQVLARLNDAAVREQLKGLETNYQFVKETFEKQERLWNQKIGSEMQYLQAKSQKESLEAQLAATRKQMDMMAIKSPINGTVEDVGVKLGQTANPAMPAFRVMNFGTLKVKADVAEAYARKINVGDEVIVFFPDLDKEVTAKVSTASRYINPINRSFQVEVRLVSGKEGYKANMVAVLKINDYKVDKANVIPVNYIQTDSEGSYVFIAENKGKTTVAKKVDVKQGQSYNGMIEITEGLKPGDKVINAGYLDLENGEEVKI